MINYIIDISGQNFVQDLPIVSGVMLILLSIVLFCMRGKKSERVEFLKSVMLGQITAFAIVLIITIANHYYAFL